jgi:ribonuclease III
MEALIAATYLDGGLAPAVQLVRRLFGELIASNEAQSWSKDPKTELQEWLQARKLPVPGYRIVATRGQAHAQTFEVECAVPALSLAEQGQGRSRRIAEQEAARRMLDQLKASDQAGGPLHA